MKLFPEKDISIPLSENHHNLIVNLKKNTIDSKQFTGYWENKTFVGEIETNTFTIQLSSFFGNFCIIKGQIYPNKLTLHLCTGMKLKIFFTLFSITVALISIDLLNRKEYGLIFAFIFILLLFRSIIEIGFRIVSQMSLKKIKMFKNNLQ
ncbi:hypothetical protein FLAVO9AF_220015 [Flavobacterium sp. 9AF]|uniref:hypothetical protein n=1 Tax=Flavobacterium sp. 9AF TaxID=2653142 RepID=UPI0012EFCE25|nr:hypothetical protein [Flavobacterium sp. 9AF]VXB59370.1 hypothetical protein FLAVO9AF_220015 [Flavobacterium sp. 9AF]